MLRRFIVERDIPGVGALSEQALGDAARVSNQALGKLSGVQWQMSFVARDKTFCVYLADSEAAIREHARLSGFPAGRITETHCVIDPATERYCALHEAAAS